MCYIVNGTGNPRVTHAIHYMYIAEKQYFARIIQLSGVITIINVALL